MVKRGLRVHCARRGRWRVAMVLSGDGDEFAASDRADKLFADSIDHSMVMLMEIRML
jgi:hypothetical protein